MNYVDITAGIIQIDHHNFFRIDSLFIRTINVQLRLVIR